MESDSLNFFLLPGVVVEFLLDHDALDRLPCPLPFPFTLPASPNLAPPGLLGLFTPSRSSKFIDDRFTPKVFASDENERLCFERFLGRVCKGYEEDAVRLSPSRMDRFGGL